MAGKGRLVIEPFRTTVRTDPQFAGNTWKTLENAICEIFNGDASHLSFESLYRASYNMVLHKHAELLYENLGGTVQGYLDKQAAAVADKNDDEFLGALDEKWKKHKVAMQMIRDILMYLDRTYVDQNNKTPVYESGLVHFQDRVARHSRIKERLLQMMLGYIQRERDGELIDRQLAKGIANMYSEISQKLYQEDFEAPFLATSEEFYERESQSFIVSCSCSDYLRKAESRLQEEATRNEHYLDARTGPKIRRKVQDTMVLAHMETLVDMESTGLVSMLRDDKVEDLGRMYTLFREVQGGTELILQRMGKYLVEFGTALVQDPQTNKEPVEYVKRLLALKAKFDNITAKAFSSKDSERGQYDKKDKSFLVTVNSSFESFLNKNARSPEYLSIYLDKQLRQELAGVAEDEAEKTLECALTMFRLLQEKDVFEKYYKQHLAKRLLGGRSVSDDLEKTFVSKLKNECGNQFTGRMEAMFNDMRVSSETKESYRVFCSEASSKQEVDLSVHVLTTGCWPTLPPQKEVMLPELEAACTQFQGYYLAQHTGRKLIWQTNMGTADLRATLGGKKRELVVTTQQMFLLLQFNEAERLTFAELAEATGMPKGDCVRNLQSLACVKKHLILSKEPAGREVLETDVFSVNSEFQSKLSKIKISTVSSAKETVAEVVKTREKVEDDRKPLVEAAVVRIMKSRKVLDHNGIVAEVTKQLGAHFVPSPQFIKKRIESLIERDYLERSKDDQRTYRYLS